VDATDGAVHREVIELAASPAQVRRFIMDPQRILDYYPSPVDAGTFEEGRSLWCRGQGSVSMLELLEDQSTDDCVVVLVTTAVGLEPPYTPEGLRAAMVFTMVEDWALAATPEGTTLIKTWRDVHAAGDASLPLGDAIRESAKAETEPLVTRWNEAARTAG
jgi:hypothetical protein